MSEHKCLISSEIVENLQISEKKSSNIPEIEFIVSSDVHFSLLKKR